MPTYTWLTTDDRYSVPSLSFQTADGELAARLAARQDLAANPHHQQVEVRDGDRLLFVERRAPQTATPA